MLDQRVVAEGPVPWDCRIVSAPRTRLRGTSPARAGKLEGGMAFALRARGGVDRFQCLLRSGPAAATVAHRAESAADCLKIIAPSRKP